MKNVLYFSRVIAFHGGLSTLLILLLLTVSCTKETIEDTTLTATAQYVSIEACVFDVYSTADGVGKQMIMDTHTYNTQATVEQQGNVITIDYSNQSSKYMDGKNRDGLLTITYDNGYMLSNSSTTIQFNNYTIEDQTLNGTMTISSFAKTEQGVVIQKIQMMDGKFNGQDFTIELFYEFIGGASTENILIDDVYAISGSTNGYDETNQFFETEITQKVIRNKACRWTSEGKVDIIPGNKFPRILQYGEGSCDNNATVYIGLEDESIILD